MISIAAPHSILRTFESVHGVFARPYTEESLLLSKAVRRVWHPQTRSMRTREDPFIKLFLSAYENGSWADADVSKPDAIDRTNPAIDQLATRKSDGRTLAIEHTIIERFVGDKKDFAHFEPAFLGIEKDESLPVPGRMIEVFVAVGTLQNRARVARDVIVQSVRAWIKSKRLTLRNGMSEHNYNCVAGRLNCDIVLTVKVRPLSRGPLASVGILRVGRLQVVDSLDEVIVNALRKKLPKLVNTPADTHILILERQNMDLHPKRILDKIETRRDSFQALNEVDEIWIVETMGYGNDFGKTYLRFELYKGNDFRQSFDFQGGRLTMKSEDGIEEVIDQNM